MAAAGCMVLLVASCCSYHCCVIVIVIVTLMQQYLAHRLVLLQSCGCPGNIEGNDGAQRNSEEGARSSVNDCRVGRWFLKHRTSGEGEGKEQIECEGEGEGETQKSFTTGHCTEGHDSKPQKEMQGRKRSTTDRGRNAVER